MARGDDCLVKAIKGRGTKNCRLLLISGKTALVPASVAESLVGKILPDQYDIAEDGGIKQPTSAVRRQQKAEKPAPLAVAVPDIPPEELAKFADI